MCIHVYVEINIVIKMGYTVKPYIKGFTVLTTCGYLLIVKTQTGGLFIVAFLENATIGYLLESLCVCVCVSVFVCVYFCTITKKKSILEHEMGIHCSI